LVEALATAAPTLRAGAIVGHGITEFVGAEVGRFAVKAVIQTGERLASIDGPRAGR
jgi:hypothetical protein